MESHKKSILFSNKWRQVLGPQILIVHTSMDSSLGGTVILHMVMALMGSSTVILHMGSSTMILLMGMGSRNMGFGYPCKCRNYHQRIMVILIQHMDKNT